MFATTNGDYGFPLRIAKFTTTGDPTQRPVATPQDTDLPTWQLIDLSGFREEREKVIAAVVSWFTLSTLDMYWLLQGVPRTGLLASAFADFSGSPTPRRVVRRETSNFSQRKLPPCHRLPPPSRRIPIAPSFSAWKPRWRP